MKQLRLPGLDPREAIKPKASRKHPAFWIRRIRVLRELTAEPDSVVRDIELRRGLNIIWSPPRAPSQANALFQNGVAGHTAGKSTFCRLVRHLLGERTFATAVARDRIRAKFPSGWVVAEILLEHEPWVVARPLTVGAHPFAMQGRSIADVAGGERQKYDVFLEALAGTTIPALSAARFPGDPQAIGWSHLLPWLTRDQECRFSHFIDWRHESSESDSPALNVDERHFLVRAVLGLISDVERDELERNARLLAAKKSAADRSPLLRHQSQTDHERVSEALGLDLPQPSSPLFASQAGDELDRQLSALADRESRTLDSEAREDARRKLEEAVSREADARRNVSDAKARLDTESAVLRELDGHAVDDAFAKLEPGREYCNVPLTAAWEAECPLARGRPRDLAARRSDRSLAEELDVQRALVQGLTEQHATSEEALKVAQGATADARRAYLAASTKFDEDKGRLLEERANLLHAKRLVREATAAFESASELDRKLEALTRDIEQSYERQEQARRENDKALRTFSRTFDYVTRAMLGDDISGRVTASGRSLALAVTEHGERDSAAIATVRLLAFDLAALTSSAEGHGSFPRFLLHDGPREADMATDIFERLLLFARELEDCYTDEPAFQYIVTTTTAPSAALQAPPWLRLQLAGMPAEERLFKCDL